MTIAAPDAPEKKPFWRQEDPVLRDGLVVKGGMWEHQRKFWKLKTFVKGLVSGYGGGKTYVGGKRLLSGALHNAPVPSSVVSPTFRMAKKTVIPTLKEMLVAKSRLLQDFRWTFNKTDGEFNITFGRRHATIYVQSGEDPTQLPGPNLGQVWIDEPFIQKEAVFDQMVARIRDPRAKLRELIVTGTPEQLNWGYRLFTGKKRLKGEGLTIGFVQARTSDNKALPPDYIENLEATYDERTARAYIEGEFVNLSTGIVYHGFNEEDCVVSLAAPPGAMHFVGMDFNVDPFAFVVFWFHPSSQRMHVYAHHELRNADTETACAFIRQKYPEVEGVYPDASGSNRSTKAAGGATDFTYIAQAGFRIIAHRKNPRVFDRINDVNQAFRSGKVTIAPTCADLIHYLLEQTHENANKKDGLKMGHALDALGYPIHYIFPVVRPQTPTMAVIGH